MKEYFYNNFILNFDVGDVMLIIAFVILPLLFLLALKTDTNNSSMG